MLAAIDRASLEPGTAAGDEPAPAPIRVLAVDDDAALRTLYRRQLEPEGCEVVTAGSGTEALALAHDQIFDVVLSDIRMPDMDGIALLEHLHRDHPGLPVLLATGCPSIDTAIRAVELRAVRYLTKPVDFDELLDAVRSGSRIGRLAMLERAAHGLRSGREPWARSLSELVAAFERALASLRVHVQPIVDWPNDRVFGWEALMRHDVAELLPPPLLLEAAERLGRFSCVGRRIRELAAERVAELPEGAALFVNLHPADLHDDELYDPRAPLSRHATRVVLEITERQDLEGMGDLSERVARLRSLGFRLAVDDLGAGYSSLSSFAELSPDVVKLDMSLVHDIHLSPTRDRLATSMLGVCRELGVELIAEGIETEAERDHLARLGCRLMQGYLFGRPAAGFVDPFAAA